MMVTIRAFAPGDVESCATIINRCMETMSGVDEIARKTLMAENEPASLLPELSSRHTLVCERDDQITGLGSLEIAEQEIKTLYVVPAEQGKGTGSALMVALEQAAVDAGLGAVRVESTLDALPFYRRRGYIGRERVNLMSDGAVFEVVYMKKDLTPRDYLIREMLPDDAETVLNYLKQIADEPDNGILFTSSSEVPWTVEQEQFIIHTFASQDNSLMLAAIHDGELVAQAGIHSGNRQPLRHTANLGITVKRSHRGRGTGTALIQTAIDWARENSLIHRLELEVLHNNQRAIALYERLGFVHEGTRRQAACKHGEWLDLLMMAMIFDYNILERQQAWELVTEYTESETLRRHMLAVECAMRAYAEKYGGDPDVWGVVGLLHDFDYEKYPDVAVEGHPVVGSKILREKGVDETIIRAILSHAESITGIKPESQMEKTLVAVDELTGLITAVALVRPSKSVMDVKYKSIKKKWKDRSFAAGVNREEIEHAVETLGVDLREHIEFVLEAMKGCADDLGLA